MKYSMKAGEMEKSMRRKREAGAFEGFCDCFMGFVTVYSTHSTGCCDLQTFLTSMKVPLITMTHMFFYQLTPESKCIKLELPPNF